MYKVDYNSYRSIQSFNRRVRFLVLHYTTGDFITSVKELTGSSVSVHYLVPDPSEKVYTDAGFKDMRIFNLVDENDRAWHAGVSQWAGRTNLNDSSIGIEIVNRASESDGVFTFPPFNLTQIDAVKELSLNILQRYPDISPKNVVGHSDITPGRKSDPGPAFPWKELYDAGVGAWYDDKTKQGYIDQLVRSKMLPDQNETVKKLKKYGYDTSGAATAQGFKNLLRAFQLHFRPQNYDGELDNETWGIISALVDKY